MPTEEDLKAIVVHKNVRRGDDRKSDRRRKRKRTPSYSSESSDSRSYTSGSDGDERRERKELIKSIPGIPGGTQDIGFIPSRFLKRDRDSTRNSERRDHTRRISERSQRPERSETLVSYPGYQSQSTYTAKPSEDERPRDDRFKSRREGERRESERTRGGESRRGDDRRGDERRDERREDERRDERRDDDRRGDERRDERREDDRREERRDERRDDDRRGERRDDRREEERRPEERRPEERRPEERRPEERRAEERRDERRADERETKRSVRRDDSLDREEEMRHKSRQTSEQRSESRPADRQSYGATKPRDTRDSPQHESAFRRSIREERVGTKYYNEREEKKKEVYKREEQDEDYDPISDEELAMLEDESGLADIFRELEREMKAKRYKAILDHIDFSALEPLTHAQSTLKDPATLLSKCGYSSAYGGKVLTEKIKELFAQRGEDAPLKGAYSANRVTVQSILQETLSPTLALSAHTDARLRRKLDALNITNKNTVSDILPLDRNANNSLLQESVKLFNSLAGTNLEVK